jgi:hypothetical protein
MAGVWGRRTLGWPGRVPLSGDGRVLGRQPLRWERQPLRWERQPAAPGAPARCAGAQPLRWERQPLREGRQNRRRPPTEAIRRSATRVAATSVGTSSARETRTISVSVSGIAWARSRARCSE